MQNGNFYGTTLSGGASNLGTVFQVGSNGDLATLVSFAGRMALNQSPVWRSGRWELLRHYMEWRPRIMPATVFQMACTFWGLKRRRPGTTNTPVGRRRAAGQGQLRGRRTNSGARPGAALPDRGVDVGGVLPGRSALGSALATARAVRRRLRRAALRHHELRRRAAVRGRARLEGSVRIGLSIAVHMLLIGVPIALFARRAQQG